MATNLRSSGQTWADTRRAGQLWFDRSLKCVLNAVRRDRNDSETVEKHQADKNLSLTRFAP